MRRVARGADDGYRSPLVIGLKSSTDAARLAEELAFADHRLRRLEHDPPGALPRGRGRRRRRRGAQLARVPDRLPVPARGRGPVRGDRARPDVVGLGRAAGARRGGVRAPDRARPVPRDEDARGLPNVGGAVRLAGGRVHRRRRVAAGAALRARVRAAVAARPASRRAVRPAGHARPARRLRHARRHRSRSVA